MWFNGMVKFGGFMVLNGEVGGGQEKIKKKQRKDELEEKSEKDEEKDSERLKPHQVKLSVEGLLGHSKPKYLKLAVATAESSVMFKAAQDPLLQTSFSFPGDDLDQSLNFELSKSTLTSEYSITVDDLLAKASFSRLSATLSALTSLDRPSSISYTNRIVMSLGYHSIRYHPKASISS